jgi:hypothetical protein
MMILQPLIFIVIIDFHHHYHHHYHHLPIFSKLIDCISQFLHGSSANNHKGFDQLYISIISIIIIP